MTGFPCPVEDCPTETDTRDSLQMHIIAKEDPDHGQAAEQSAWQDVTPGGQPAETGESTPETEGNNDDTDDDPTTDDSDTEEKPETVPTESELERQRTQTTTVDSQDTIQDTSDGADTSIEFIPEVDTTTLALGVGLMLFIALSLYILTNDDGESDAEPIDIEDSDDGGDDLDGGLV